jgi:hypothetical protein
VQCLSVPSLVGQRPETYSGRMAGRGLHGQPGLYLPGSLVERTTRCGSPRCRCHTDPSYRHGPYPSWIRKVGTKTVTRTLSPAQLERYCPLFGNTRRLRELTSELETLSAEMVEQAEGWTTP